MTLDDLHDAILTTIDVDVPQSNVTLVFRPMQLPGRPGKFSVTARAWTRFNYPREQPWGLGGHQDVNQVRGPFAIGLGQWRLEIELQSGDTLELHASSFETKSEDGDADAEDAGAPAP